MEILLYPKQISFYGGGSYAGGGVTEGNVVKGAYASAGNFYVNTVTDDPNGIAVSYTKSDSNSGSEWANCPNGKQHAYWGDEIHGETGVYQVGKGLTINAYTIHNAYNKGGDLYCGWFAEGTGHTHYNHNLVIQHRYIKLAWPTEKIIKIRQGNYYGANLSESYTQLANGYFTGPRTYKTTGNKWGFTIQSKTSLKWSNYVTDITIDVTGPHTSQKSKPENFLWVAGGVQGGESFPFYTRAVEVGACYYDFKGAYTPDIGHPNYLKLIGSVKSIMSTSSEDFTLSGIGYPNSFTSRSSTNTGITYQITHGGTSSTLELAGFNTIVQGGINSVESSTTTTEWKSHSEDEPWPIISTEQTVGNKVVFTTVNGGYGRFALGQRMVFTASKGKDGSYYLSTAMGNSYVGGVLPYGYGTFASGETNTARGSDIYIYGKQNKSWYGGEQDYYITECREFGVISRKYKTSHRGYYFTDPDTVYQDAKDFDTYSYLDVSTYSCHDATCIDIQRWARKTGFQTAKTLHNAIVEATYRVPRRAIPPTKVKMTLRKEQGYSKYQYDETRIWDDRYDSAPIWGHPKYKKNKYGEDASYSFTGFKSVTVGGTATRLVPITQSGEAHTESWRAVGYNAPATNWFNNPWQLSLPSQ